MGSHQLTKGTYRCSGHFLNEIQDEICCYAQMCSDIYQTCADVFELGTMFEMCQPSGNHVTTKGCQPIHLRSVPDTEVFDLCPEYDAFGASLL